MKAANPKHGKSSSVSPRKERTRRAIREALLVLLESRSLDDIKVKDLTDQAEVGYASFFRHYETKEQILDEVAYQEVTQIIELTLPLMDIHNPQVVCRAACSYINERRPIWAALLAGGAGGTLRDIFVKLAIENPSPNVPKRKWLPIELGTHFGVAAALEIISWWLKNPGRLTPNQLAIVIERLVVSPAVSTK